MTITSGLFGVLIAATHGKVNWFYAFLSIIGLILAHASNNLINDYIDVKNGVDTEDYPRAQYSTHPILGGLTTPSGLLKGAALLTAIDGLIMIYLTIQRGPLVLYFALFGLFLSIAYTGLLKKLALGEITSFLVWGPLMIAGTAFVTIGEINSEILLASLPYGLIVASVLVGKHIDKIGPDTEKGVKTIPVLLGEKNSKVLNKINFILFYVMIFALVIYKVTTPYILLTLLAIPRLIESWKIHSQDKPDSPPEGWTVWPLWYVGWAMYFNRKAGELLIGGLLLGLLIPWIISLF
jgi:1,4-dihydroxy-2-naphthoate octaprenyltransferase